MNETGEFALERALLSLETEINKLKLELLRQELSEKINSFRMHNDNRKYFVQNGTNLSSIHRIRPLSFGRNTKDLRSLTSALHIKVYDSLEIWQLVLIVFLVWVLLRNLF